MATKREKALEIYKRHLPTKPTMGKRAWRALVVEDFKKELDISSYGTIGMYFSAVDQIANGRTAKQYNVTAPRQATKAAKERKKAEKEMPTEKKLNELAAAFAGAGGKSDAKPSITNF